MNQKIKVPKALHELFGEEQIKSELIIIIVFSVVSFFALAIGTQEEWIGLEWYKIVLLFLLMLDILGGVASNYSWGTNQYYLNRPKKGWIFIVIHIQPFLLAWIFHSHLEAASLVWLYTIGASALIHLLQAKAYQRILAVALFGFGMIVFILFQFNLPKVLTIMFMLYMFKLIAGFAVNHQKVGKF